MSQSADDYERIGLDQLLVFAGLCIEQRGEKISFEKLVAECFERFPRRFELPGYPQWPDSSKVNKSWLRCRTDRGWMAGSPKRGFRVTDAGRSEAHRVQAMLEGTDEFVAHQKDSGFKRMIDHIRRSNGFKKYSSGEPHLSEELLVDSLGAPLEASRVRLREQLRFAEQSAKTLHDEEVIAYLVVVQSALHARLRRDWKNRSD